MDSEILAIQKKLKKDLDKERYEHTIGVMYTAGCLAMTYQCPMDKALLAGLLHDCAKGITDEQKIRICQEHGFPITKAEQDNPGLLHAKAGSILACEKFDIQDQQILHAIRVHTTGEPDMGLLDKILYVADYIEPHRDKALHLDEIRTMAFHHLNQCVLAISHDTLYYLSRRTGSIDPLTEQTYEFYKKQEDLEWKHSTL